MFHQILLRYHNFYDANKTSRNIFSHKNQINSPRFSFTLTEIHCVLGVRWLDWLPSSTKNTSQITHNRECLAHISQTQYICFDEEKIKKIPAMALHGCSREPFNPTNNDGNSNTPTSLQTAKTFRRNSNLILFAINRFLLISNIII